MKTSSLRRQLACLAAVLLTVVFARAEQDTILVINEIMYHPQEGEPEWMELRNLNGVDVDISEWTLEGAVDYEFPKGTVVLGNSYLVVASDVSKVADAMGPFKGQLDDAGEEIRLVNNSGRVMCIVDYNDRGEWPIAADGGGVSLAKIEIDTLATDPANWTWSEQAGGTPGAVNFPNGHAPSLLTFNEVSAVDDDDFSVEIGLSASALEVRSLEGVRIQSSSGDEFTFAGGSLAIGEWSSITADTLAFEAITEGDHFYLVSPEGRLLDALRVRQSARARFPDFDGPWMRPDASTPGEANQVTLQDAIVINEIMFHHRPQYPDEVVGEPYRSNPEEWIELYNRGEATVDLAGWSLDKAVRFQFPAATTIAPGGYLVVSNDAAELKTYYPDIQIIGDFGGELNNHMDTIVLRDASGNPADSVSYFDGGNWPGSSDGAGSSLELRHPMSDNSMAGSWAASDESLKSEWKEYTYRGEAVRPPGTNFPTRWNEFVIGLLDRGEFLIDDISVIEDPDGAAIRKIRNGSFTPSLFGADGSQNWRLLGNHGGHGKTVLVTDPNNESSRALHVVASSATEHMHNHLETTLSGDPVRAGMEYEISYRAKWLSGSPQLNTRLYFNWLAKTTILELPTLNGTPGLRNSTFAENIGPVYAELGSQPAIAKDGEPILIHVRVQDPDGLASVVVRWKLADKEAFETLPMTLVKDDLYEAMIPGQATVNLFGAFTEGIIQFYVEGTDTAGAVSWYPEDGPESRALIPFEDGREVDGPGHNLRIVMTAEDTEFIHEVTNVMSNDRMPCTLIYKESEAFYNVGVRLKGSQRGRNQDVRKGFSLKMPADNRFRGLHGTIAVDRSGAGNQYSQKEMLVKHAINRAGDIPGMYDDLIHVVAPKRTPQDPHTGSAMLLMARYDAEFLDGIFENGTDGRMFEYELIYAPNTTEGGVEGLKRPEPDSVTGVPHRDLGDDKETYRWHYLTENNRDADDYAGIMEVLKTMGMSAGDEYFARLHELFDTDQWLRSFAIQILFGIGDAYPSGAQHNMIIYIHPNGKSMFFPWDMDFTFNQGATSSIDQHGDLRKMMGDPLVERSYYAQVYELLNTVYNSGYMDRWIDHYQTFLTDQPSLNSFKSYIASRNKSAESQLRSKFDKVLFSIDSMNGADFEVSASTVTLEGTGWIDIATIRVGDREYEPTWIDRDRWQLTLPLVEGENKLNLQAVDINGSTGSIFSPLGDDSITITNTGGIEAANASNLIVSEIMYHPVAPTPSELAAGFANDDDFEFIELQNIGATKIDLAGVRFTNGIDFDFSPGTTLDSGAYVVLVANEDAFKHRYPDVSVIGGVYDNRLRNSGESLRIRAVDDGIIKEFAYNDAEPWPVAADGEGASLVLIDGMTNPDPNLAENWAPSAQSGGSPGSGETAREPDAAYEAWLAERGGDGSADPDGDGFPLVMDFALGADLAGVPVANLLPGMVMVDADGVATPALSYRKRGGTTIRYEVETSTDLQSWQGAQGSLLEVSETANGDGTSTVVARPIQTSVVGYFRLRVSP